MSFLIQDDELLERYDEIWENVENNIKKEFDSEPVYNKNDLKGKIKSYNGKINTDFHNNEIPKEESNFFLSVFLIDSVFRAGKNYYPYVFVPESSDDSGREDSNDKNSDKKNNNKEN